jgi:hypothetical protein
VCQPECYPCECQFRRRGLLLRCKLGDGCCIGACELDGGNCNICNATKLVRDASTRPCSHLQLSCRGRVWHECVLHRPFAIDAIACASQVFPMAGSASTSFARSIGDRYRCKLARATSLETDGTAMRRLACCWLTRHDGIAHSLSCQDFSMLREGYDDSTFAGHLLDRRLIASAPRDSR